jgi:hypothetical protein
VGAFVNVRVTGIARVSTMPRQEGETVKKKAHSATGAHASYLDGPLQLLRHQLQRV